MRACTRPRHDGEVTATMKVRRKSIAEKYAQVIEEIYV